MNSSTNVNSVFVKNLGAGDFVRVRDCDGVFWDRVFWEVRGDIVYLSSPERYQRMINGDVNARPVGFLVSHVAPYV